MTLGKANRINIITPKIKPDFDCPTLLYEDDKHAVYWLGIDSNTAFRCNTYLIADGREYILIDPGSHGFFAQVKQRVAQIVDPLKVSAILLCHQDPDVAASMEDWLQLNNKIKVIASPRAHLLLPHYGVSGYDFYDIEEKPEYSLPSGKALCFVTAPFLHSPMAFATYDTASHYLFSGDIYAAVDSNWQLVVNDFEAHKESMDLFHIDYMASNIAARGFVKKLERFSIEAILPQHGSIIPGEYVQDALNYLNNLCCGTDVIYPELN